MNSEDRRAYEESALFERLARDGDPRDRAALVERFLPLARTLALRYQRSGEPFDDLLQVASLGLIKAIDGFDTSRGIAFSAYAVPTILGEIKRYFRDRTWAVHVPSHLQELTLRVDRAVGELAERLRRQPSVEEAVLDALQAGGAYRARSFDEPSSNNSGEDVVTLGESIGVAEHGFARVEARVTFAAMLTVVTSREREVLRMRFEDDMTQAEIAVEIGASQMHVSRIIRGALARIRDAAM
jgi:RNA polymerase sigma-B factor